MAKNIKKVLAKKVAIW